MTMFYASDSAPVSVIDANLSVKCKWSQKITICALWIQKEKLSTSC